MIGRQDPGPDLDAGPGRVLRQEIPIELVVLVAEEGLRPAIAPLSHMVRDAFENSTRHSSHGRQLERSRALAQSLVHCHRNPRRGRLRRNTCLAPAKISFPHY